MNKFASYWTDDTLSSLLERQARERPEAAAIVSEHGTMRYAELAAHVEAKAQALAALGIGSGDVVSVQLPNAGEFLIAYLAIARLGAVLSTIHMPYRAREAADLMRAARSRAFIGPTKWHGQNPVEEMLAVAASLPDVRAFIAVGAGAPPSAVAWDQLSGTRSKALPELPMPDRPFLLLYTSGTSAKPKGIQADYRRFMANARTNIPEMGIGPDSVMLSAAPYTHLLGLLTFHMLLHVGGTNLLLSEFAPQAFVDAIRKGRPSHVFAAPAHVAACLSQDILDSEALTSVRYFVVSGATAPGTLYRDLKARMRDGAVAQVWGMTELQCGIFHRPGETIERVAMTCGRPAPGFETRVVGLDERALDAGADGELQVRGVSVIEGYFENPEVTAAAFTPDGWFRTGDTAMIDAEGYVAITGRLKDIINRGGIKINPLDVEEAIARHPSVAQCAIAPVPDPVLGERACAYVVLKPNCRLALTEITEWLARHEFAKIKWPERLEIIAEMPLTPTRKVIKSRLRPAAPA
ncbi:MAG: class I adenylate-forming enzyme family protein [Alphaproteobacteria bacterium]